jgi:coiled-coil domain-containing protein 55
LQADATIFDYDGHFDGFQDSRKQKVKSQDEERVERKSRYIESLMAKQKERDREQDIIYERRLLKERMKEDHLYGDKDKFVTASYRKKLEEDRKWLEEEKITDAKEAAEDVAKKGDLSGFYHNLMSRNTAAGAVADKGRAAPEPAKEDEAALAKKREQERRDAEGAKRRAAFEQLKALEDAEAKKIEEDANRRADPNAPEKRHKPTRPPGGGLEIRRHPAEVEAEERAAAERAKAADVAAEELSKQTLQEQRKAKADDAKARYLARKKAAAAAAP